jgi:hypothetical protein
VSHRFETAGRSGVFRSRIFFKIIEDGDRDARPEAVEIEIALARAGAFAVR